MPRKKPQKPKPKPATERKCDVCGSPAEYELLDRIADSDIYAVEKLLCGRCAGVAEEAE